MLNKIFNLFRKPVQQPNAKTYIKVWCRLGADLKLTEDECRNFRSLTQEQLTEIIKRGFDVDGDSYVPESTVEELNEEHNNLFTDTNDVGEVDTDFPVIHINIVGE